MLIEQRNDIHLNIARCLQHSKFSYMSQKEEIRLLNLHLKITEKSIINYMDEDDDDILNHKSTEKKSFNNNSNDNNNKRSKEDERGKNEISSSSSKKNEKMNGEGEKDEKSKPSWLMTGIRVRLISKKSSSYLMKGSVIDVPTKSVGTIRLDGGKIVEGVKEKYLETVLPPIGGICSVLYGQYRGQNARLIEKRKEEGLAFIQLEDDLEGVLLSMDAIASRM